MRRTKRWWLATTGSVLCLLGTACSDEIPDNPGVGMTAGMGAMIAPPAGGNPMGMVPGATAGSAAPPVMQPMNPGMTNTGTGGSGGAPPVTMPMAGSTAMPMAGSTAMPMAGSMAMPMAGSTAMPMTPVDISMCPPAPADAPESAKAALTYLNTQRLAAGAGCVTMVSGINKAAENHCKYYIDPANDGMCTANPHNEVMGCAGFTGTGPGQRMMAAGYVARGGGEVMAFLNNPKGAIDTWINSVWHRIPLLDPWTGDMGYGGTAGCDTIDFGTGAMGVPATTILVYPYDGQTNVPPSFNGQYEGPMPPAPPTGWPSANPITLYGRMLNITEHVLTKDGDTTPIEHTWITGSDPMWGGYLRTSVFMYGHKPFEANTKYRVKMVGTSQGGALNKEWTFTTGAASTRPGRP